MNKEGKIRSSNNKRERKLRQWHYLLRNWQVQTESENKEMTEEMKADARRGEMRVSKEGKRENIH